MPKSRSGSHAAPLGGHYLMVQCVQLSKHNIPKRTHKSILGSYLTSLSSVCGLWPRADLPKDELKVCRYIAGQTDTA